MLVEAAGGLQNALAGLFRVRRVGTEGCGHFWTDLLNLLFYSIAADPLMISSGRLSAHNRLSGDRNRG